MPCPQWAAATGARHLGDARWAYHDRQAEIDWGYRAVHETARVTKAVIEAFYSQQPQQSYFAGCSTGGRQAVMEAWRYPNDVDGIISGAPGVHASNWYRAHQRSPRLHVRSSHFAL
jgi:feruloyl esterase